MKSYRYFFIEKVLLGNKRLDYSFPDVIGTLQAQQLANLIDSDPELINLTYSPEATAQQIWDKLSKTPLGQELTKSSPDIIKYRISAERKGSDAVAPGAYQPQRKGDEDTTSQLDRFDKWANLEGGAGHPEGMPSFKQFFAPTKEAADKFRNNEVSGAGPKQTPVSVATQKQNPLQVPQEKQ